MEANNNTAPENQPQEQVQTDIPAFEQNLQDTQTTDSNFNDMLGLPNVEENTAPPTHEDTQTIVEKEVAPQQDFSQQEVNPEDNEQVRYQYWQSQAAKLQNQLNEVKEYQPMVDYLRANPEAVQSITPGGKPAEAAPTSQEQEEFPPPPERPEQPTGFSREEAYSDPASASAKYLDAVDKWRDDTQQYNQLAAKYEIALMREQYNQKIEGLEKVEQQRVAQAEESKKMNEVREYVANNYDLGENLDDFLTSMNDPNSINMDDLVGYYKYKKGMGSIAPAQPTNAAPSKAFNQMNSAQSVPQPMGVQPAQTNAPSDPSNDFMDMLIKDNKQREIL